LNTPFAHAIDVSCVTVTSEEVRTGALHTGVVILHTAHATVCVVIGFGSVQKLGSTIAPVELTQFTSRTCVVVLPEVGRVAFAVQESVVPPSIHAHVQR